MTNMKKTRAGGVSPHQREFFFVLSSENTQAASRWLDDASSEAKSGCAYSLDRDEAEALRERLLSELREFGC